MANEIKINVPEGMEIDRENSTFECIKFKKKTLAFNFKPGDWICVKSNRGSEYLGMFDRWEMDEDNRELLYVSYMIDDNYLCGNDPIPLIHVDSIAEMREVNANEMKHIIDVLYTNGYIWDNITHTVIKKPVLPKTWEEFCETHDIKSGEECFIHTCSEICSVDRSWGKRFDGVDRNLLPNKETAEAFLALMQLIQLRDCYNDGWMPDWKDLYENKYCICSYSQNLTGDTYYTTSQVLAFKTPELRNQFLENFRELINTAKPLI